MAKRYHRNQQTRSKTPDLDLSESHVRPSSPVSLRSRMGRVSMGNWGSMNNLDHILNNLQESIQQSQKKCYNSYESLDAIDSDGNIDEESRVGDDDQDSGIRDTVGLQKSKSDIIISDRFIHKKVDDSDDDKAFVKEKDFKTELVKPRRRLPEITQTVPTRDSSAPRVTFDGSSVQTGPVQCPASQVKEVARQIQDMWPMTDSSASVLEKDKDRRSWLAPPETDVRRNRSSSLISDTQSDSPSDRNNNDSRHSYTPRFTKNQSSQKRVFPTISKSRSRWDTSSPVMFKNQGGSSDIVHPAPDQLPLPAHASKRHSMSSFQDIMDSDSLSVVSTTSDSQSETSGWSHPKSTGMDSLVGTGALHGIQRSFSNSSFGSDTSGSSRLRWNKSDQSFGALSHIPMEQENEQQGPAPTRGGTILFITDDDSEDNSSSTRHARDRSPSPHRPPRTCGSPSRAMWKQPHAPRSSSAHTGSAGTNDSQNSTPCAFFVHYPQDSPPRPASKDTSAPISPIAEEMTEEDRAVKFPQWVIPFIDDNISGTFEYQQDKKGQVRKRSQSTPGHSKTSTPRTSISAAKPSTGKSPPVGKAMTPTRSLTSPPVRGPASRITSPRPVTPKARAVRDTAKPRPSEPVAPPRTRKVPRTDDRDVRSPTPVNVSKAPKLPERLTKLDTSKKSLPPPPDNFDLHSPIINIDSSLAYPGDVTEGRKKFNPIATSSIPTSPDSDHSDHFPVHVMKHDAPPEVPPTRGSRLKVSATPKPSLTNFRVDGGNSERQSRTQTRGGDSSLAARRSRSTDSLNLLGLSNRSSDRRGSAAPALTSPKLQPAKTKSSTIRAQIGSKSILDRSMSRDRLSSTSSTDSRVKTPVGTPGRERGSERAGSVTPGRRLYQRQESNSSESSSSTRSSSRVGSKTAPGKTLDKRWNSNTNLKYDDSDSFTLPRKTTPADTASTHEGGYGTLRSSKSKSKELPMPTKSILKSSTKNEAAYTKSTVKARTRSPAVIKRTLPQVPSDNIPSRTAPKASLAKSQDNLNTSKSQPKSGSSDTRQGRASRRDTQGSSSSSLNVPPTGSDVQRQRARSPVSSRYQRLMDGHLGSAGHGDEGASPVRPPRKPTASKGANPTDKENSFDSGVEFIMHL